MRKYTRIVHLHWQLSENETNWNSDDPRDTIEEKAIWSVYC